MTRSPATPPDGLRRKHRSLRVERDACLYALGLDPEMLIEWQHEPPLGVRPWNKDLGDYEPAENDPRHLRPMQAAAHRKVTSEIDRPAIDKARRQATAQRVHAEAMKRFGLTAGITKDKPRKQWPKRKLRSRGFDRRPA